MKIAVFSDTHGNIDFALSVIDQYGPDLILHLGDSARDAKDIHRRRPDIPIEYVTGNWYDDGTEEIVKVIRPMGVGILLTHGHKHNVDAGLARLEREAAAHGVSIALYGHTHTPNHRVIDGIRYMNPGTAGKSRALTWGRIELGEGRIIECRIVTGITD